MDKVSGIRVFQVTQSPRAEFPKGRNAFGDVATRYQIWYKDKDSRHVPHRHRWHAGKTRSKIHTEVYSLMETIWFKDYYGFRMQRTPDRKEFSIPLGVTEGNIMKTFPITHMPHRNILVTGHAGTGKSTFLHVIMNTIFLRQSADQAQIWLYDTTGYEFQACQKNHPPHIAYVGSGDQDSSFEAFLQSLEEDYKIRTQLLAKSGESMFVNWVEKRGSACMPQAFVLIDCFDHLLKMYSDRSDMMCRITTLLRQGFLLGVTFIVTAQDCMFFRWMDKQMNMQFGIRIGLAQADETLRELLEIPSAYILDTNLRRGEAMIVDFDYYKIKLLSISPETEKKIIRLCCKSD